MFERWPLAQDRDCNRTLQLAEPDTGYVLETLIDASIVEPLRLPKRFVHRLTDRTFRSAIYLPYFHPCRLAKIDDSSSSD